MLIVIVAWNWVDADPSPGEFAPVAETKLLPIISHVTVVPDLTNIRPDDNVTISFDLRPGPSLRWAALLALLFSFSARPAVTMSELQYFVDDVISDFPNDHTVVSIAFVYDALTDTYTAVLPAHPASTVIRYRCDYT